MAYIMSNGQYRWWIATLKRDKGPPELCELVDYIKGQLERGAGGFEHWQFVCHTRKKSRLRALKLIWPDAHLEPTRSVAALEYVCKDDTRIGEPFELGDRPIDRARPKDWQAIWDAAAGGNLESIPPDVRVRCYNALCRIGTDYSKPVALERSAVVYWGRTGTGKSRQAWSEAGLDAYPKDPRTKWWDGYCGEPNVVIDEFRGAIDIVHLLRWLDRYPVRVERKGGAVVLRATRIWFTSNLHPDFWYPEIDAATKDALSRRLEIKEFE